MKVYDNSFSQKEIYIQTSDDMKIKLQTKGTTLLFTSKTPTQYKLDTFQHVELTSDVEWAPLLGKEYPTFNDRAFARAPLTGAHFISDSRRASRR